MSRQLSCLLVLATLALVGCGGSSSSNNNEVDSIEQSNIDGVYKIRYHFEKDFCDTGVHTVKGYSEREAVGSFCTALSDNELNNKCARDLRKQHYHDYCSDRDDDGDSHSSHARYFRTLDEGDEIH